MKNYFQFFSLEPAFHLDEVALKRAYLLKSREFHPDYFTLASEEEKNHALDMTTQNNEAYKVLSDTTKRLEHILRIYQILTEGTEDKMDPAFLMEMMEINEMIMEVQMEKNEKLLLKVQAEILTKSKTMDEEANEHTVLFDQTKEMNHLEALKDYYFKKKYLRRILDRLEGIDPSV